MAPGVGPGRHPPPHEPDRHLPTTLPPPLALALAAGRFRDLLRRHPAVPLAGPAGGGRGRPVRPVPLFPPLPPGPPAVPEPGGRSSCRCAPAAWPSTWAGSWECCCFPWSAGIRTGCWGGGPCCWGRSSSPGWTPAWTWRASGPAPSGRGPATGGMAGSALGLYATLFLEGRRRATFEPDRGNMGQ